MERLQKVFVPAESTISRIDIDQGGNLIVHVKRSPTVWRSMESAPQTGRHILLALLDGEVHEGWWDAKSSGPGYPWKFVGGLSSRPANAKPFQKGFLNAAKENGVTHWRPLPDRP